MHTTQLIAGCLAAAVLATGCNRQDADATAERAAAGMRSAAGRAGEQLADGWLTTKIQAQYFADDDVKARYIEVSTEDGIVTLRGTVDTPAAKDVALQIAANTDGVRDIRDQLAVVGDGVGQGSAQADTRWSMPATPRAASEAPVGTTGEVTAPLSDADVTSLVQSKFYLDDALKTRSIQVGTENGVVTLRGEVTSDDERAQALLLARTTRGVERVEDALTVNIPAAAPATPAASADETLGSQVREKLSADATVKAGTIEVSARDGVVLLDGTMPTAAAKQRAVTLTRETAGVVQVIDRLTVRRRN
jgi:hyperosmotically inducible protein